MQYEKFDWKILKTEHFDIYYYDNFGEMAEIGAKFAEDAFDEYKVKFNNYISRKIPLIFYNTHIQFEQTNIASGFIPEGVGGFFEFIKGRVVIPYLGSIEEFKHVIRHELVHVFMSNKIYNVLKDHRVSTDKAPPLWFTEGLAEYWSFNGDTQSEMIMRDAVLNGYFVDLPNLYSIEGTYLMYKEGQYFLQFISKQYGEDKILLLMENFWRFSTFEKVIEFTLGDKIEEINNKWVFSLKQKYFPLYQKNYPISIKAIKLTDSGFNFAPRFYSADTTKEIYFVGNKDGYTSIYKMNYEPDNEEFVEPIRVIQGEKDAIFEAFHLLDNSFDVSKNGIIAFVTKSLGSDVIHLFSINENKLIDTFKFDELISIRSLSFSNDGKKIVFSATDKKGFVDIFLLDLTENKLNRITNDYYSDTDPIFNKDGSAIIFCSDRTGGIFSQKVNLFEININSREIKYLTYTNCNISTPHFNPEYNKLYFTCDYDGVYNIWELNLTDSIPIGMTQLTKFVTSAYDFSFVNNTTVVTAGFEKFSFQFYSIDLANVSDTAKKYVKFNFDQTGVKWDAGKISLQSEAQKVKYEKQYSLDYAVSQLVTDPVYGTRGGALFLLSDLMGDDNYLFYIYNTAEVQSEILKNFNVAISRINLGERANYGYGIFHYAGRRYDIRESDEFFYERVFGGYFDLFYPFSSFDRIETDVSLANSDKELFEDIIGRKSLLLSNSLSFVHDNSIWGPTGPLDGSRFRVLLGYTSDIKYSNVNYYSFILDYRKYFRLGLRTTLAARASIFINHGKQARRYFAGGSWDLRGWPRFGIRGEKLWLSSVELRFPLIDLLLINFPIFGLSFFNIRGALYFDAGSAWDNSYYQTLGSIGTGIRINLFNAIVLRYDVGKKIENNFKHFQPKLFYQFFFGFDF
ncbi:peptidase MA family metallohydrolase [Melioribacteraceae bacterium 4301-Me]|uniref:peptidase MA family metallohydrolase n=1 Tax=Pyranulibacter aquaticus TaxID=3163344 RepID=UPI00359627D4